MWPLKPGSHCLALLSTFIEKTSVMTSAPGKAAVFTRTEQPRLFSSYKTDNKSSVKRSSIAGKHDSPVSDVTVNAVVSRADSKTG